MMKLVGNEHTKLLASGLNRSYGASNASGFVLPGLPAFVYLLVGVAPMLIARLVLRDLVE